MATGEASGSGFTWHNSSVADRLPLSLPRSALQEADEARTTMARNKQFASFQLRQAEIKARRRAAEKIEEMQLAAQIQLTVREQVRRPLICWECRSSSQCMWRTPLHLSQLPGPTLPAPLTASYHSLASPPLSLPLAGGGVPAVCRRMGGRVPAAGQEHSAAGAQPEQEGHLQHGNGIITAGRHQSAAAFFLTIFLE